jgi:hypothetical protein
VARTYYNDVVFFLLKHRSAKFREV